MRAFLVSVLKIILSPLLNRLDRLCDEIERNRMLIVQPRIREFSSINHVSSLSEAEFRVFSQWGEDGIIQYLISKVPVRNHVFVEFGVGDYKESNTRFLLMNNNWRGTVIDCDNRSVEKIKECELYWRYDITALCAHITKENICSILHDAGISGDIGLLSIDIDGNDYWIWEEISSSKISPRIVIVEYNSLFGSQYQVTIPYSSTFNRTEAHYSNLYFGASLKALCMLAETKGYKFVGTNSAGSNAFYVRNDVAMKLNAIDCATGYVQGVARESRNKKGALTYMGISDGLRLIEDKPVIELESKKLLKIKELNIR